MRNFIATILTVLVGLMATATLAEAQFKSESKGTFQEVTASWASYDEDNTGATFVSFYAWTESSTSTFKSPGNQQTSSYEHVYWRFTAQRCTWGPTSGSCTITEELFGQDGAFVKGDGITFKGGGFKLTFVPNSDVGARYDPFYDWDPNRCTNQRFQWSPYVWGGGTLTTPDDIVYAKNPIGQYRWGFNRGRYQCPESATGGKG